MKLIIIHSGWDLTNLIEFQHILQETKGSFDTMIIIITLEKEDTNESVCQDVDKIQSGELVLPIETFFLMNRSPAELDLKKWTEKTEPYQVIKGVKLLPEIGIISKTNLTFVYLSSAYKSGFKNDFINKINSFPYVDLFVSHFWPRGIINYKETKEKIKRSQNGSNKVKDLLCYFDPRYIISGSDDLFFERVPYSTCKNYLTRFISLAKKHNKLHERYLIALELEKIKKAISTNQTFTSQNNNDNYITMSGKQTNKKYTGRPWQQKIVQNLNEKKRKIIQLNPKNLNEKQNEKMNKNNKKEEEEEKDADEEEEEENNKKYVKCSFCLSSRSFPAHLVFSVGKFSFLTLKPDPIVQNHLQLITIPHTSTIRNDLSLKQEIASFENSLFNCCNAYKLELISFAIYSSSSFHFFIDYLPIENDLFIEFEKLLIPISSNLNIPLEHGSNQEIEKKIKTENLLLIKFGKNKNYFIKHHNPSNILQSILLSLNVISSKKNPNITKFAEMPQSEQFQIAQELQKKFDKFEPNF
ncbi:cwf19-like protein [Anaeramoeba flamelloides]|uniref:Cwf19-like protein n=1 Tax=Anaeramoeba flamelloides TaxID=1746091 RepID=A0ABQ8XDG4_9EUKA|nr:cwf19-like protein [Anaeramoeba flamelloides]